MRTVRLTSEKALVCRGWRSKRKLLKAVLLVFLPIAASAQPDVRFGGGFSDELDGHSTHVAALGVSLGARHDWELAVTHFGERNMRQRVPSRTVVSAARRFGSGRFQLLFGPALNDHGDEILSGHWQWISGLEVSTRLGRLSIRHLSNGGMTGRNRGETWFQWSLPLGREDTH